MQKIPPISKHLKCFESTAANEVQLFTSILRMHYKSKTSTLVAPLFKPLLSSACNITMDDIYKEYDKDAITKMSVALKYDPENVTLSELVL